MPIVILEGPDGSGKSTLANSLLKGTGLSTILIRRSGPPLEYETLARQINWLNAQDPNLNILIDRHPLISEKIYRRILRDQDWLEWDFAKVASALNSDHTLVLYCRPPWKTLLETSKIEDQLQGVHERLHRLVDAYDAMMDALSDRGVRVRRYAFTEFGPITDQVRSFFTTGDFDGPIAADIRPPIKANNELPPGPSGKWSPSGLRNSGEPGYAGGDDDAPSGAPLD